MPFTYFLVLYLVRNRLNLKKQSYLNIKIRKTITSKGLRFLILDPTCFHKVTFNLVIVDEIKVQKASDAAGSALSLLHIVYANIMCFYFVLTSRKTIFPVISWFYMVFSFFNFSRPFDNKHGHGKG